jgi:RimJ/RimL family protein N-acetyltransferase
MEIKGEKVTLIPIKAVEKEEFYRLATESYGSKFWYDDEKKTRLTKEEFFKDWHDGYFDLNSPEKGQCFWIVVGGEKIGQINYNKIDLENKKTDLDIIIGAEDRMRKGYGSDALRALINYLFENFNINKIGTGARANNPRAIRTYEKAGFKKEGLLREEDYFEGKFVDCIKFGILRKDFQ